MCQGTRDSAVNRKVHSAGWGTDAKQMHNLANGGDAAMPRLDVAVGIVTEQLLKLQSDEL